jgi:signal transduction histidine kinase/transcriptional regulator with GAF, ATPase, and Fis domain/ActR/RegA family two-component response regulator
LTSAGEPLGLISFGRKENQRFCEREREFISLLGNIFGQAIANHRRTSRMVAVAARSHVLNEVALLLYQRESIEAIFQRLLDLIDLAIEVDYVGLLEPGELPGTMRMVGSRPELVRPAGAVEAIEALRMDLLEQAPGVVVQYRIDRQPDVSVFNRVMHRNEMRRGVSIPIRQDGTLVGFLSLARRREERYDADEVAFLETLSTMLGQAIVNRRRLEASMREAARSRLLNEIAVLLNRGEPPEAFFDRLAAHLQEVLPFDGLVLLVPHGNRRLRVVQSLRKVFADGEILAIDDFGSMILDRLQRETVVEGDTAAMDGSITARSAAGGIRRGAVAALTQQGATLGYLLFGRADGAPFSEEEQELMRTLATLMAQALANHSKVEESRAEAIRSQVLSELALLLQGGNSVQDHFDRLSELLLQAVGFDFISITVHDPVAGSYRSSRSAELWLDGQPVAFDPAGAELLLRDYGQITQYRTADVQGLQVPAGLAEAGFQRAVTAIIPNPDGPPGLLTIGRRDDLRYGDREMAFIRLVAALLGQAAANHAKTYAREAEALRNRILSDLALLLNDGEPVEVHFNRLCELLLQGVGFDYCSVVAREPTGEGFRTMRSIPAYDEHGNELPFDPSSLDFLIKNNLRSSQYGLEGLENGAPGNLFDAGLRMVFSVLLSAGTGIEGALTIGRKSPVRFRREERTFFELVGSLLSYAIANERRIAMSAAEAEEQGIIARAAAAVARQTGTLAIVASLRDAIADFVPAPFVNFGFLEGEEAVFPARDGRPARLPVGEFLDPLFQEGQVVGPGERSFPVEVVQELDRLGIRVPVLTAASSGGNVVGLLVVATRDPGFEFGARELRLIRLIADIVGPAMANVRAVERERQEAEDQRVLAEVAAVCAREADPAALVNALHRPLRVLVPRPVVAFGFSDGDAVVYPRGDGSLVQASGDPYMEMTKELGQIHADELPEDSDRRGILRQLGVHATCTTAVRAAGETVGFLLAGSRQPGYRFGRRERALLRLVSQIVGPAMENARAAMRAREEAEEQRILAEVAAVCAREADADAIINALPGYLRSFVPQPVVLEGEFRGDETHYRIPDPLLREFFGAARFVVPFTPAGFAARDHGQATGNVDDLPPGNPYTAFDVHAFALTAYYSAGSMTRMFLVASRDPDFAFSERHLELLRKIVLVVGPAIEAARAQQEVARQGELYSLILRSLTEGVILIDRDGRAVFANGLGRKLLSPIGPGEPVTSREDLMPRLPADVRAAYENAFLNGEPASVRASIELDGRLTHFDYELVPLADPHMKVLIVAIDVTADVLRREEQEQARERMAQASRLAALGELIGGVAHELNNPLTAVLGFAELIASNAAASPVSEEVAIIQKEALRARNIVRDLLFIARPGTSERQLVPVSELVAHIERLRRNRWSALGITADIRIDPACQVWGNEHQLTQVILNLVTNAEHVLRERQDGRLTITGESDGARTRIVVADNGKGMDDATRSRIFEPFFTTRPGLGTGLGLPLSYSIVQSHFGTISVESAPGAGATFIVDLPATAAAAEGDPSAETAPPRPAARVLVVDDEPSLRKVCQRLITSLGHQCETAESTAAALTIASTRDFDVVLCDYRLATETADQVLNGFARLAPQLIPRTIIATGATTDPGVLQLVERYGLKLVAKPYGVEELSRIIAESRAG